MVKKTPGDLAPVSVHKVCDFKMSGASVFSLTRHP